SLRSCLGPPVAHLIINAPNEPTTLSTHMNAIGVSETHPVAFQITKPGPSSKLMMKTPFSSRQDQKHRTTGASLHRNHTPRPTPPPHDRGSGKQVDECRTIGHAEPRAGVGADAGVKRAVRPFGDVHKSLGMLPEGWRYESELGTERGEQ